MELGLACLGKSAHHNTPPLCWTLHEEQVECSLLMCSLACRLHNDYTRTHTGNLYVTRYKDGQIVMLSPSGATLKTFQLPLSVITNLEMGGKDGKTLVAVGRCANTKTRGCVELRKVEAAPGRAWQMLQDGLPKPM